MRRKRQIDVSVATFAIKLNELKKGLVIKETSNYGYELDNYLIVLEDPQEEAVKFLCNNSVPFHDSRITVKVMEEQRIFKKSFYVKYKQGIPYVMNVVKCEQKND